MSFDGAGLTAATGSGWEVKRGPRTERFYDQITSGSKSLPHEAADTIISEAVDILAHCVDPSSVPRSNALLAVGKVQSGKTLSFTTLTTLARDNGFGVVILLAGTTDNLRSQSEDRLVKDLELKSLQSWRNWTHVSNPNEDGLASARTTLEAWRRRRDLKVKKDQPALLITVLKNHHRLSSLAKLLARLELNDIPALIIDDEADQATLNTFADKNRRDQTDDESSTYASIREIRLRLPFHSFVQYTATPQANLLLAIADELNPSYASVLTVGKGYTGGEYYFEQRPELIRSVPVSDYYDPKAPQVEAPPSLRDAFRSYLLLASAADLKDEIENRSMLVQVSQSTTPHAAYARWVGDLRAVWADLHELGDVDLESEFRATWTDIESTWADAPSFDDVWQNLSEIWTQISIVQVNSGGQEVSWEANPFWVLIGGQKLDRGFTVEGLVVTYMPRSKAGTVDTLQQRARFFGYRGSYASSSRVYLPQDVRDLYADYVVDERTLHNSLRKHAGRPLSEWSRAFQISGEMKGLVRRGVVGRNVKRFSYDQGWISQHEVPSASQVEDNRGLVANFKLDLERTDGLRNFLDVAPSSYRDLRKRDASDVVALDVDVKRVIPLLLDYQADGDDRDRLAALRVWLSSSVDLVDVVFVNELLTVGQDGRTVSGLKGTIFTGRNPQGEKDLSKLRFSGEREIHREGQPTLHLRSFNVVDAPIGSSRSEVPWYAFYVPQPSRRDVMIASLR